MDRNRPYGSAQSLRRRLAHWIALAFAATIALLTATAVMEERRLVFEIDAANGNSLLAHLASMPDLRDNRAAALAHVEHLDATLRGAGIRLELVAASTPPDEHVVASRRVELADGHFELRFRRDAPWLARSMRRALAFHLILGATALVILVVGAEWILRARLVEPLRRMAHQMRFMRQGGGWHPKLPPFDAELTDVARALEELGPALDAQMQEWLEGERRAAAASALADLRARLREPQHRALALLGDLQARELVSPHAKQKVRALVLEVERVTREIRSEEARLFGTQQQASIVETR